MSATFTRRMRSFLSNMATSTLKPVRASTSGILRWCRRLEPSLVNTGWRFSLITNTTSCALPELPISSPSPGKVTFVPAFHPGLTTTSSTASASRESVADERFTFIFFVAPLYRSSREQWRSNTAGLEPCPIRIPAMPGPAWPPMPPIPPIPPRPPMPGPPGPPNIPNISSKGDSPKDDDRLKESLKNLAKMSLGSPENW
mmetsp:Transcript_11348/g.21421  ORF Transcript_11348/g.21421 Transcript_11348/m.21421 type:complete len:200 (+) Transcript_11348:447-1046(+)